MPEPRHDRPVAIRFRPGVVVAALALLTYGLVHGARTGIHAGSLLPLIAGIFILIANSRLARGSTAPPNSTEDSLKERQRYIRKTIFLENVGDAGERAAAQLTQMNDRFEQFQSLLRQKFEPQEITFTRYQNAAEEAYAAIFSNLERAASTLNNLSAIDPKTIDAGLKQNGPDTSALQERQALRNQQTALVNELLSFNEKAITEFDRVSTALTQIQTHQNQSPKNLEAIMTDLSVLAERAKRYSISE